MPAFDEVALVRELGSLASDSRIAFAALCAERLFPAYELYADRSGRGDPDGLAGALEAAWVHLSGQPLDHIDSLLAHVESLLAADAGVPRIPETGAGEAALITVAYVLRTMREGSAQESAWAARRVYETLVEYVIERIGVASEAAAIAHPIVQEELALQRGDLSDLAASPPSPDLFARLRSRTRTETASSVLWARL